MSLLRIRDASKRYGEILALDRVSFDLESGEILALLGPNGSGKSTLMRCLVTLERLDSGSITLAEVEVQADPAAARGHLGYAGQDMALDKVLTGREFLRFQAGIVHLPRTEIAGRVDEMLRRFELEDAADRLCEGYSGGMRRRLDLAASLMHRPRLVVLDEPSAGLDWEARRRLWQTLEELRREGTSLLLATHDFEEADLLADRVVLMSRGRVAGQGTPAELRRELGDWILVLALHEHPTPGDHEQLAALGEALGGRPLPPDPHRPELSLAVQGEGGDEGARTWSGRVHDLAREQGLSLFSLTVRRPTLQDVYRSATGEPVEVES